MSSEYMPSKPGRLAWIVHTSLTEKLHATARLEPCRELQSLGWEVSLIAPGPQGTQAIRGVEVDCVPMPRIFLLGQVVFHLGVMRLLARSWSTLDVLLFHQMTLIWLLPFKLLRWLSGRRLPLLVMDTRTLPMASDNRKGRSRARFYRTVSRMANRWADGQTAITQHMAKAVGIPRDQLWGVWPSGVNLERFSPAVTTRQWPLNGEPIRLIYLGILNRERNLLTLSRAVERANAEGMLFALSLVGKGTEQDNLESYARQTDGRVRVLPPVPHEQVPAVLAQAHVGVLPFPDEEKHRVSSYIKTFEYMAAGLPLLATRIVALTDVAEDGDYAFWAEDASEEGLLAALRDVWACRQHLSRMGDEAAKAAQGWTWHESARKLSCALEQGIARTGGDRVPLHSEGA